LAGSMEILDLENACTDFSIFNLFHIMLMYILNSDRKIFRTWFWDSQTADINNTDISLTIASAPHYSIAQLS
jgi:hypothetical protein